jgi:hypothetical protein
MILLTFREFVKGEFEDGEEYYELYVVKNAIEILYVGISQSGIWNRWFGGFGRMHQRESGCWYGYDDISKEIAENMPASLDWIVELWTTEDCMKMFEEKIKSAGFVADRLTIKDYEHWMIEKLRPELNIIFADYPRKPRPMSEERARRMIEAII